MLTFFLQEAMFPKNTGAPLTTVAVKDLWKHRSLDHVGWRSPFVVCGRAWLLVSLFVCSLESTGMECHGDPQFVFSTKIRWKEVLFLHPQKGGIFTTWLYFHFLINPWSAKNSRESSSTPTQIEHPKCIFFYLFVQSQRLLWCRWCSAIFFHYFRVCNHDTGKG